MTFPSTSPTASSLLLPSSPRSPTAPYTWPPQPEQLRSRAPEFYGFVAWTSTYLLFVLYALWALLPDKWIRAVGVDWYPSREWALLVPSWSIILVILTYISYSALALQRQPAFKDMSSVVDSRTALPSNDVDSLAPDIEPYLASANRNTIPELYDIPIGLVNSVLYSDALREPQQNDKSGHAIRLTFWKG